MRPASFQGFTSPQYKSAPLNSSASLTVSSNPEFGSVPNHKLVMQTYLFCLGLELWIVQRRSTVNNSDLDSGYALCALCVSRAISCYGHSFPPNTASRSGFEDLTLLVSPSPNLLSLLHHLVAVSFLRSSGQRLPILFSLG